MSVDWRGLSMAMAQLKELTEPSKMELMEREYELRAIEGQKERAFEESKYVYESNKTDYEENEAEIKRVTENIISMDGSALGLKEEYQSPDFQHVVKKNDMMYKDKLDGLNSDIEQKLIAQTDYLDNITTLYNNMMYGKQIRETQGGDKYNTITEEKTYTLNNDDWNQLNPEQRQDVVLQLNDDPDSQVSADEWTVDSLNQYLQNNSMEWQYQDSREVAWDMNNDGVIMSEEYNAALDDTIKDMEEAGISTVGIKEGFYSGFNPQENDEEAIDVLRNQVALEQDLEDLKDDISEKSDAETLYDEALETHQKKNLKNQFKIDEDRLVAFKDYKQDLALYMSGLNKKGNYKENAPISKAQWDGAKKSLQRHMEVLTNEEIEMITGGWKKGSESIDDGYGWINNSDFIDHGFDQDLEKHIHNFDFDEMLPLATNVEKFDTQIQLKAELNWLVENWDNFSNKVGNAEFRQKFIDTYNNFHELFPDHFAAKDNWFSYQDNILDGWKD